MSVPSELGHLAMPTNFLAQGKAANKTPELKNSFCGALFVSLLQKGTRTIRRIPFCTEKGSLIAKMSGAQKVTLTK